MPLLFYTSDVKLLARSLRVSAALMSASLLLSSPTARAASVDALYHSPVLTDAVSPQRVLVLPDDSFFVFWNFNRVEAKDLGPLVKFKPDGTHDPSFRMQGDFFHVITATLAPDGKVIVAALHKGKLGSSYRVLRLNADGSVKWWRHRRRRPSLRICFDRCSVDFGDARFRK